MHLTDLLAFIPEEELDQLAAESNVDHQVKKLSGKIMFQLILFSMLNSEKASLRIMESLLESMQFRMLSGQQDLSSRYNSIGDRIATVNPVFFQRIFSLLFDRFNRHFAEKDSLLLYDSTMVGISSGLVEWGMKAGRHTGKVQLKYTVGMKGSFPCHVKVFDQPEAACEDKTIPEAVFEDIQRTSSIVVFDRGVRKRQVWKQLCEEDIRFVSRTKTGIVHDVIESNPVEEQPDESVVVEKDQTVVFKNSRGKWTDQQFRLVKARIKDTGEAIFFITNIMHQDAGPYSIAGIYRKRWDIEVLFRFLKQHLNLNHLVSRNHNGIRVMIYMTLILAILIIAYRKENKCSSYKIAKLKCSLELEEEITKQIVILCGGDPAKAQFLWNSS